MPLRGNRNHLLLVSLSRRLGGHRFVTIQSCFELSPGKRVFYAPSVVREGPRSLSAWLAKAPGAVFVGYCIAVAFGTYFCMYAFRKPFAAAKFDGQFFLGTQVALKTAIVISQIIGYALSKFIGIKVCSESSGSKRAWTLAFLIIWAELALVLFAVLPPNWKVLAILLNGLPLGMVWGLVVSYLEGRRTAEILLAGLSCSYIISSGIVKDFGRALMEGSFASWWNTVPLIGPAMARLTGQVSEDWMPAVAGMYFFPIFLVMTWLLNQIPRPSAADVSERAERAPMDRAKRLAFVKQFGLGLFLLCTAYFFLTAYRDFRDNYQVELFDELGYSYAQNKTIISRTELLVMFGVVTALALLSLFRENRSGLVAAFAVMATGTVLMGVSTALLQMKLISGFWWMTLSGIGSYLAYVPYGSVLFERLMASTRFVGTAVFAIYVADAIGYTGSVGIQLFRDLVQSSTSRLSFFISFSYLMAAVGTICLAWSCLYFIRRKPVPEPARPEPAEAAN